MAFEYVLQSSRRRFETPSRIFERREPAQGVHVLGVERDDFRKGRDRPFEIVGLDLGLAEALKNPVVARMTEQNLSVDLDLTLQTPTRPFDLGQPHEEEKMIGKRFEPTTNGGLGRFEIGTLFMDGRERENSAKSVRFGLRQLAGQVLGSEEITLLERNLVQDIGRVRVEWTPLCVSKHTIEALEISAKSI